MTFRPAFHFERKRSFMRFSAYELNGSPGLGVESGDAWRGLRAGDAGFPGTLESLIMSGGDALAAAGRKLAAAPEIRISSVKLMPPLSHPEKVICVGLNYRDHSAESGFKQPDFPALFGHFISSLIGHGAPILRPEQSVQLDYEGELAAVIGKTARDVSEPDGLDYVMGNSIFNDGSILSSFLTLKPGDVIVTRTPSGAGMARQPQLFMKHGDRCEVEIEKIGVLSNPVRDRKQLQEGRPSRSKT